MTRTMCCMIGDAPSDLEAAGRNGILFYPILVRYEEESWRKFLQGAWEKFIALNYRGDFPAPGKPGISE